MTEASNDLAVYAFSDSTDATPTTFEITAAGTDVVWWCQVLMPGNSPMTQQSTQVSCQANRSDEAFLVNADYPTLELPPRTSASALQPPELPPLMETNCVPDACSTTAQVFDPSPAFPHVRIFVRSSVASEATIAVHGNGRAFEVLVALLEPSDVAYGRTGVYLNVDQPPTP